MKPPVFIEVAVNLVKIFFKIIYYFLSCKFLQKTPKLRLLAVFFVFLALFGMNIYRLKMKGMAMGKMFAPKPAHVATVVVEAHKWRDLVSLVGTINSENGAILSAEVSGKVSKINVQNGSSVKKGDLLIEVDSVAELASLKAAKIKLNASSNKYNRAKKLVKIGSISKEEFEQEEYQFQSSLSEVDSLESQISRRNIKAPFDGVVGVRRVNVGDYVNPGREILPIFNTRDLNLDFTIPQNYMNDFAVGANITFKLDTDKVYSAKVTSFDPQIDLQTRTIKVQAKCDPSSEIKPGIFAKIEFPIGREVDVFPIPATAVIKAPYGDSVYVVKQIKGIHPIHKEYREYIGVEQKFIKIMVAKGDQVGVISGLNPGDKIVTNGVFRLMPNAEIVEDNSVQPDNSENPNPENS